jgi:hypothetical protein
MCSCLNKFCGGRVFQQTLIRNEDREFECTMSMKRVKVHLCLLPIVAGLEKFTNILTIRSQYVSVGMAAILPFH